MYGRLWDMLSNFLSGVFLCIDIRFCKFYRIKSLSLVILWFSSILFKSKIISAMKKKFGNSVVYAPEIAILESQPILLPRQFLVRGSVADPQDRLLDPMHDGPFLNDLHSSIVTRFNFNVERSLVAQIDQKNNHTGLKRGFVQRLMYSIYKAKTCVHPVVWSIHPN